MDYFVGGDSGKGFRGTNKPQTANVVVFYSEFWGHGGTENARGTVLQNIFGRRAKTHVLCAGHRHK